ncbi:hypothetical protein BC835DRAFT_1081818 [Cytidiella melzeri]|nr:hypothetical protein BC835DRAFT_1081818 [Cytidiella melzeri]
MTACVLDSDSYAYILNVSQSMPGQSRRHPPHPIKIPAGNDTKLFSHADTESAQLSKASSKRQSSRSLSNYTRKSTRAASLRQSRHHSLTHSRPRFHSRSRPSSLRSARSHNEESDADDALSTVSGTTIARALVSSYFITTSPSGHRSRSSMVLTKHRPLARQDSTTLPIADYPFLYRGNSRRRSHRSSKGSTSSDVRTPISGNYWRDRKISGDQIVVLSPEERQKEEWTLDVPPLPPMPSGLSPMPPTSARSLEQGQGPGESQDQGQSQSTVTKNVSGSFSSAVGSSSGRFGSTKTLSTGSISGKWSGKYIIVDAEPEQKRRSVSVVSEWTESAPGQSSMSSEASGASDDSMQHVAQAPNRRSVTFSAVTSNESVGMKPTSVEDGQDISYEPSPLSRHTSSPDAPTTATSPSTSVYSKNAYAGASVSPAESTSLYSSPGHGGILSPGLTSIVSSADSSYVRTPGSSVAGSAGSQDQSFRSFAASRQPRNLSPGRHLITMLPIGERPRSTLVSHSPSSHNTSSMIIRPQSMVSSTRTSLDSPDLLDIMFAGSRGPLARNSTIAMRVISPPAPISVPPRTPFALSNNDEASPSAVRQQFPETPYAFTPLASAGFSPAPDEMPLSLPRTGSLTMRGSRARRGSISMGRKVLIKSATMASPPSSATPEAPPYSVIDSTNVVSATPSSSTGGLSIIEEVSVLNSPVSQYDHSPPDSPALSTRRAYTDPAPSYPASPADIRLSMPPAYELDALSVPLPPSRSPTPSRSSSPASHPTSPHKRRHESTLDTEDPSDTTIHAESEEEEVSPPPSPRPSLPPSPQSLEYRVGSESAESASSLRQQQHLHPAYGSTGHKARARTRPPPPTGPRKPTGTGNFTTLLNRARDASVSSVTSSPNLSAGPGGSRNPMSDSSSPKFQTTPVKFRGLTMEAAQWTFTSQELQSIVSTAVKQSSDPYAIRLLPSDTVQTEVPEEIERVEKLSADLKTKYKLGMRKREKLLGTLRSIAEGSELADHAASSRYLEELVELSDSLDHISEDLYIATDQLRQLTHLRDLHATSALAMAVRKLNTSFIKHLAENQRLRQQVVELRDERDEAWAQAENAARELDAFCGQLAMGSDGGDGATTPGQSRRSSAVVVARKVSVRKASLRSSSRMRSQRSPVASNTAVSPANRIAPPDEVIPPVPPIPMRVPLGVLTAGLSTGVSSGERRSATVIGWIDIDIGMSISFFFLLQGCL